MRDSLRFVIVAAFLVGGCDKSSPEPNEPANEANTPAAPSPEPNAEPPAVELAPTLPEADVRALFDTWLEAQNVGNFEAYSATYADKFEGIKRVGARMYRYGREGWLKDRHRMFKKKMKVDAANVKLQTSPTTAVVVFEQTWASGSYKDVGPKQLILVKEPSGLRIAREEMLASHVLDNDGTDTRRYDPQAMALLVDNGVVLETAPKRSWAKGRAELISRPNSAQRAVDLEKSGFGSWVGRDVELFGPDGEPCPAKITELRLVARIIPHFTTVQAWEGELASEGVPRASDAEVAGEIWRTAADAALGDGIQLVGVLDGGCKDAVWARPKGAAATPLRARRLEGPERRSVIEAFTDLPGYHSVQADYDASGSRGAWHEAADALVEVNRFGSWIAASARAGYGCGSFEGGYWAVFASGPQRSMILQTDEDDPGLWHFAPKAAAKIGDTVYFTDGERVVSKVGDSWELLWHALPLNFDCGC